VIDYNHPMPDGHSSPLVVNFTSVDPQIPKKRLTKILNIKRIKDCLNDKIGTNSVNFTDAAHRTQQQMYYSEGQDVSLHASFVCLLHLANE
jgi:hypothetical protein